MSYAIYVGGNLTDTRHAYLAGYGDEPSSHWLEIAPRQRHEPGSVIEVGVTPEALTPGVRSTIPQVGETFRHLRVCYTHYLGVPGPIMNGGLNAHGVAVRDVWSDSSERLCALTPADQRGPNYSDLARLVLERATSAREGVELIGDLIAAYGESTYGGNSHLIADENEAWVVIEFAGGQGLWVAERLGPDDIRVSRPGYIVDIPLDYMEREDFIGPPHLISFAIERGWVDPSVETFEVNAIYGDGKGRRAAVEWMEDELRRRASDGSRIGLADIVWAVRTERLTGDTAGYGQVMPLAPAEHDELRLLWHAPIGAIAAPFTPFLLGVAGVPPEFAQHRYLTEGEAARFVSAEDGDDDKSQVGQRVEATRSAVAIYKRLLYVLAEHHETFLPEVTPVWEALERNLSAEVQDVVAAAAILIEQGRPDLAEPTLTRYCAQAALQALDLGEAMLNGMEARSRVLFGLRTDTSWRGPEVLW
jgi:dipeptidase